MRVGLSHFVATLYDTNDIINVFGNYSFIKKNASLPRHLSNPMTVEDFVVYALQNGEWKDMGEVTGYHVYKIAIGMEYVYVCTNENGIRYLLGVGEF